MPIILIFFNTRDLLCSSYGLGLRHTPNRTDSDVTFPDHAISGKSQKNDRKIIMDAWLICWPKF